MRAAIFALTPAGARQAARVRQALTGADVFLSERLSETPEARELAGEGEVYFFPRLALCVRQKFFQYDALVFLMATGIVVRAIAPLLRGKLEDPAIVVLDEQARHVISLLAGHVGGANLLAESLAAELGSDPVITTATDTEGLLAPDAIAGRLGLRPAPHGAILAVNRALLAGRTVHYYVAEELKLAGFYAEKLREMGQEVSFLTEKSKAPADAESLRVLLTEYAQENEAEFDLCLTPRRLLAGVGCRRGVTAEQIEAALSAAVARLGLPLVALDSLASTTVKADEAGLLQAADALHLPLVFYSSEKLSEVVRRYGLKESPFVKKTIGAGSVAEAAALAAAGKQGGRIALGKTIFEKVTVALVWQK